MIALCAFAMSSSPVAVSSPVASKTRLQLREKEVAELRDQVSKLQESAKLYEAACKGYKTRIAYFERERVPELRAKNDTLDLQLQDSLEEIAQLGASLRAARERVSQHEKTGAADAGTCIVCFHNFSGEPDEEGRYHFKMLIKHKHDNVGHIICSGCYARTVRLTGRCWCNEPATPDGIRICGD